jgi:UDP-N-acetylglucosamine acyltransferase
VIHPQAIIDPGATLGSGVHVGPFSIIGADVEIGNNTWIGPHVVINGPTRIGEGNKIYQFASIGEAPQDLKYRGERTRLEIGDRNVIRECVTMSRGTEGGGGITRIGHDGLFMAYVHVAHDCQISDHVIFANNATLAGHVEVGKAAVLGGFVGIHQFCKIGEGVMLGVGAVALKDVPPFVMAYGNPAQPYGLNMRGLKRRGHTMDSIRALKDAYKSVYRPGVTIDVALDEIAPLASQFPEVASFCEFIRTAERGIIR